MGRTISSSSLLLLCKDKYMIYFVVIFNLRTRLIIFFFFNQDIKSNHSSAQYALKVLVGVLWTKNEEKGRMEGRLKELN